MRLLLATCLIFGAAAVPAFAQPFANASTSVANYTVADSTPRKSCESLAAFKGDGIVSINARIVPAAADTPQHCRVTGVITPEVAFEVNLPDRWNRRFYMTGNGGLAGDALDGPTHPDRTAGLSNGFVHARTNTGHDARKEPSGSFVLSNPRKAIDYAYRAVHVTAETAKKIAADYYAQPIQFCTGTPARTAAVRVCSRRSATPTTSTASSPTRRGSIRPGSPLARCGTRRRSPRHPSLPRSCSWWRRR